jgi:hypothetical protein
MRLRLEDGLLFVDVTLVLNEKSIRLEKVIVDTGSAGCVFATDELFALGIKPERHDRLDRIQGVGGGTEFVFSRQIHRLSVGDLEARDFKIEVGAMKYGFDLHGIIGLDFLTQSRAIIDLDQLEIRKPV